MNFATNAIFIKVQRYEYFYEISKLKANFLYKI